MSREIQRALQGQKHYRRWEKLVGYGIQDLKEHLERRFLPGMTWENYGRDGWHVDHITPKSLFNYKSADDIDFKRCWSLTNLQPLWAWDNKSKGNQHKRPFQPGLSFSPNLFTPPCKAREDYFFAALQSTKNRHQEGICATESQSMFSH